jgi:nucleoid-associated protein EbfC
LFTTLLRPLAADGHHPMPNFNNMMKQVQAMQANMQKAQAEIASLEVIGESGGGMVKVTMNGRHEVKRVQIETSVGAEDREMLEDLIAAATNDAVHKVETRVQEKMSGLTAGLNLPPGMKLPF